MQRALTSCMAAAVLAVLIVGLVARAGGVSSADLACQAHTGDYTVCEMWRDLRCVLSFGLGALVCYSLHTDAEQHPCSIGDGEEPQCSLVAPCIW